MGKSAYYQKIEQQVNQLCANNKFKEAYKLCVEAYHTSPTETDLLKLKDRVAKDIQNQNKEIIDRKLAEVKPLWSQKKYKEILFKIKPLVRISPRNEKLLKNIKKAQDLYREQIKNTEKQFFDKFRIKFDPLIGTNHQELLTKLFNLERKNPGNKKIIAFTASYRDKIIKSEIDNMKEVLDSDKFDIIYRFLDGLKNIDKKNPRIKEIEEQIKRKHFGSQIEEAGEFVYQGEQHLDVLMKLKKYEKAIIVAEEIIEIDKDNQKIAKILEKAKRKYFFQTREDSIDLIQQNLPKLKQEYKNNKKEFIKL